MKMKFTPVLLAGALLFGISSTNAQSSFQAKVSPLNVNGQILASKKMPNLISLPGTNQTYQPDGFGGWIHMYNETYTYDNLGRLTDRISLDANTNDTTYRSTYAYDAQGNIIEDFSYWTDWPTPLLTMSPNSTKYFYTYNADNYPTEIYSQQYEPSDSAFYNSARVVKTFTATGQLQQETYQNWDGNTWQLMGRYTITYTSAAATSPAEMLIEELNGGILENSERITDIVWHHYSIPKALFHNDWQPLSYNLHSWDGTAWQYTHRGNITYDMYGGSVETVEMNDNGNWINDSRFTVSFDTHGTYTGEKEDLWNGSAWETEWQEEEVITYNANLDIVERLYRELHNGGTLHDDYKEVYGNFQYISSANKSVAELPVSIYPNPAQNSLFVSGEITGATVSFTDLTGRTVLTQKLPAGSTKIDISSLTSGTYILRVSNSSGSKTQKVVKL